MTRVKIGPSFGELTSLPGCSQVVVSHGVFVPKEHRGKGEGKSANVARLRHIWDELGYDYALCTVESTNVAQLAILTNNGWTRLAEFMSSRTGHLVYLYGISKT
jgi:RimJ/RimL family protein N-acetyltransferase